MIKTHSAKRALSGVCTSGSIILLLNKTIFDIMGRQKQMKNNEALARFVYESIPNIKMVYTLSKVYRGAPFLFKH